MVLIVAVTPSSTSTSIMRVPTVRIGSSRLTLRRSIGMPRASWMASTMSCDVTEPKRRPSSPAWRGLGDLARDQVVAQVALRDVDDRPAGAELLVVLEEDRVRHVSGRGPGRAR